MAIWFGEWIEIMIDWLILMPCQPVWDFFMFKSKEIRFITCSHIYSFCQIASKRLSFLYTFRSNMNNLQTDLFDLSMVPWHITNLGQNGPRSNSNERVLHTSPISRAWVSPSNAVLYHAQDTCFLLGLVGLLITFYVVSTHKRLFNTKSCLYIYMKYIWFFKD